MPTQPKTPDVGSVAHGQGKNQTVRSADGTHIGFSKIGSGPLPLVIVHGALSSGEQWMPVATAMTEHCSCYVMDRWGRGGSDDRADYSLEREVEDIRAVLEVAGPDAYLLGHSSGAIYNLEAALHAPLAGLILYEPPLHAFHGPFVEDVLDCIRMAAREERFDDVVSIFFNDEARVPENELSRLKATQLWEHMVALAPQSVREWEELGEVGLTVDRYRNVAVPTLLLAGTITKNHPSFATQALESILPHARTVMLDGQGHSGSQSAPDLVAKVATSFMLEGSR
jgi:pimeloyl-ACP methyl ester carboxylesterase